MINKHKISVSVGEDTIVLIRKAIREGKFRNRSHAFEDSLKKMLEEEDGC